MKKLAVLFMLVVSFAAGVFGQEKTVQIYSNVVNVAQKITTTDNNVMNIDFDIPFNTKQLIITYSIFRDRQHLEAKRGQFVKLLDGVTKLATKGLLSVGEVVPLPGEDKADIYFEGDSRISSTEGVFYKNNPQKNRGTITIANQDYIYSTNVLVEVVALIPNQINGPAKQRLYEKVLEYANDALYLFLDKKEREEFASCIVDRVSPKIDWGKIDSMAEYEVNKIETDARTECGYSIFGSANKNLRKEDILGDWWVHKLVTNNGKPDTELMAQIIVLDDGDCGYTEYGGKSTSIYEWNIENGIFYLIAKEAKFPYECQKIMSDRIIFRTEKEEVLFTRPKYILKERNMSSK